MGFPSKLCVAQSLHFQLFSSTVLCCSTQLTPSPSSNSVTQALSAGHDRTCNFSAAAVDLLLEMSSFLCSLAKHRASNLSEQEGKECAGTEAPLLGTTCVFSGSLCCCCPIYPGTSSPGPAVPSVTSSRPCCRAAALKGSWAWAPQRLPPSGIALQSFTFAGSRFRWVSRVVDERDAARAWCSRRQSPRGWHKARLCPASRACSAGTGSCSSTTGSGKRWACAPHLTVLLSC